MQGDQGVDPGGAGGWNAHRNGRDHQQRRRRSEQRQGIGWRNAEEITAQKPACQYRDGDPCGASQRYPRQSDASDQPDSSDKRTTEAAFAPSAIRMPISRVRRETR